MTSLRRYYHLLKEQHDHIDQDWWPTVSQNPRFEIMAGCILTQNTSWQNVEKALENLYHEELLTPDAIRKVDRQELKELVKPSGYYNQKAKRLKRLANFLKENPIDELLNADVEEVREQLLDIKGIGEETADSILLYALNKPVFVIDAYTKRIVSRWGIAPEDISYKELQEKFMEQLPESVDLYKEYHALLVEHAKAVCKTSPLCEACHLLEECEQNI